ESPRCFFDFSGSYGVTFPWHDVILHLPGGPARQRGNGENLGAGGVFDWIASTAVPSGVILSQLSRHFHGQPQVQLGVLGRHFHAVLPQHRPRGVEAILAADFRCLGMTELVRMPVFQAVPFAGLVDRVSQCHRLVTLTGYAARTTLLAANLARLHLRLALAA